MRGLTALGVAWAAVGVTTNAVRSAGVTALEKLLT